MANTFDIIQSKASSLYIMASNFADSAFGKVQEVLPALTKADAKTLVFGAAFFASLCLKPVLTSLSTFAGVFAGREIFDFAGRGVDIFNNQTSSVKLAVVAGTVATLAALKLINRLNDFLKSAAVVTVGLYTGLSLGRSH